MGYGCGNTTTLSIKKNVIFTEISFKPNNVDQTAKNKVTLKSQIPTAEFATVLSNIKQKDAIFFAPNDDNTKKFDLLILCIQQNILQFLKKTQLSGFFKLLMNEPHVLLCCNNIQHVFNDLITSNDEKTMSWEEFSLITRLKDFCYDCIYHQQPNDDSKKESTTKFNFKLKKTWNK